MGAYILHTLSNRTTVGDSAYEKIRSDIIFARLKPGLRLKLDDVRSSYVVSVSTIREILYRLNAENLVLVDQRGFSVAPVTQKNFRDIAAMRILLEGYALQKAFQRGDIEWEAEIAATYHRLARLEQKILAGDRSNTELWKNYDRMFHHSLVSSCGSEMLLHTYAQIFDQYLRYQIVCVTFRGEGAAKEHRDLMECAMDRNHKKALEILTTHIQSCVDYTINSGLLPKDAS